LARPRPELPQPQCPRMPAGAAGRARPPTGSAKRAGRPGRSGRGTAGMAFRLEYRLRQMPAVQNIYRPDPGAFRAKSPAARIRGPNGEPSRYGPAGGYRPNRPPEPCLQGKRAPGAFGVREGCVPDGRKRGRMGTVASSGARSERRFKRGTGSGQGFRVGSRRPAGLDRKGVRIRADVRVSGDIGDQRMSGDRDVRGRGYVQDRRNVPDPCEVPDCGRNRKGRFPSAGLRIR
jgi:hypothetical protein